MHKTVLFQPIKTKIRTSSYTQRIVSKTLSSQSPEEPTMTMHKVIPTPRTLFPPNKSPTFFIIVPTNVARSTLDNAPKCYLQLPSTYIVPAALFLAVSQTH
jgi:hypothetical protein